MNDPKLNNGEDDLPNEHTSDENISDSSTPKSSKKGAFTSPTTHQIITVHKAVGEICIRAEKIW